MMEFQSAGISLPGKNLPAQVDSIRVVSPRAGETAFVLCEGIFYAEALHALLDTLFRAPGDLRDRIRASLIAADRAVAKKVVEEDDDELGWSLLGAGSIVHFKERWAVMAWVGCSRAITFRSGQVLWKNRPHTVAQAMEAQGTEITSEHAGLRNVLMKAFGNPQECAEPELIVPVDVSPDDIILLCSEGVDRYVSEAEIATYIEPNDLVRSARTIAECAVARGCVIPATVLIGKALEPE